MPYLTFYVPFPDEITAQEVSKEAIARKFAACANIFRVNSVYRWQEVMQEESEWAALLKTSLENEQILETWILEKHPYEVPCIMRWEVRANPAYERWILDCLE